MKTSNYADTLEPTKRYVFWMRGERDPQWTMFMHFFETVEDAEETIAYCQSVRDYEELKFALLEVEMRVIKEIDPP